MNDLRVLTEANGGGQGPVGSIGVNLEIGSASNQFLHDGG